MRIKLQRYKLAAREYISRRLFDDQGCWTITGKATLKAYQRVAKVAILPPLSICKKSNCIIIGSRIFNQLTDEARSEAHLVMTARDIKRIIFLPRSWAYDLQAYKDVCALVLRNDEIAYQNLKRRIEVVIKKTGARLVVANSTMDPINRMWLEVARTMGLKTACVQHGVYTKKAPKYLYEEDIVDHYVSLDQEQSKIIERNIAATKIVALGERSSFLWEPPAKSLKICFVGEDWERFGRIELKNNIINTYKDICLFLKEKGIDSLYYKPHPSETYFGAIHKHAKFIRNKDLMDPDVYIGFTSTLLKEMSSKNRLGVQIVASEMPSDVFEELGYCLSIKHDDKLLENLIKTITSSQCVPQICNRNITEIIKNFDRRESDSEY